MKKPPKNDLVKLLAFFAVLASVFYLIDYAINAWPNIIENTCKLTKPSKVIGGKLYNSWGPTQYFLSYAGKDKITGDDCVVSNVPVTLSEYERRMYTGGK